MVNLDIVLLRRLKIANEIKKLERRIISLKAQLTEEQGEYNARHDKRMDQRDYTTR